MRPFTHALLFSISLLIGTAAAGDMREIELTDGSVLTGEVLSLSNGVYTVRTGSLGTISVNASTVRTIRSQGAAGAPSPPGTHAAEIQALETRMLQDKDIMALIETLKSDADFQRTIQDPDIMRAINAGDIAALAASPEFLKLLQKPAVQDIQRKAAR